jgi:hypothetical protein
MAGQTTQAACLKVRGSARSKATAAAVFALLKDGDTWPRWSSFKSSEIERAGQYERYGVGAIRILSTHVTRAREEITELVPDQKLSYVLLSGMPFRNYRADVRLTSTDGGATLIDWTASFQCRYGMGWFWRAFMNRVLSTLSRELAAAAENTNPVGS